MGADPPSAIDTIQRADELGIDFPDAIRAYREAYRAAGHEGEGEAYLRVPAYLAETEERARFELRDSLMHFYQRQADLAVDSARRPGGPAASNASDGPSGCAVWPARTRCASR
jgi:hypothetical protein